MIEGPEGKEVLEDVGRKAEEKSLVRRVASDHRFGLQRFLSRPGALCSRFRKNMEFMSLVRMRFRNVSVLANLCTTITVDEPAPGLKTIFSFKIPDQRSGKNDKGDSLNASYYHTVNPLTKTAVGVEVIHSFSSSVNTITIGTQHSLDPLTTVKARVNNTGKASALIQHEWRPKSLFTISGEVDTKSIDKGAKFGLALALKP
ncbi:hypothetical protein LOK49_LG08G02507 [Camellia lanceoleosa]|uniref:Uncharacterized protein n=1 Tax=Camellia lanceoleosa TaxID=1840588 RepID=A0ACC0GQU5_9ERIC|nr:hypothetical protein LOK49_LG08G02507 [Camellia lanceoleosa]